MKGKTTERNAGIEKYTNKKIVDIAVHNTKITPDSEIYVYLETYKYGDEVDIVHASKDIPVSRTSHDANYVLYQNLEKKIMKLFKFHMQKQMNLNLLIK